MLPDNSPNHSQRIVAARAEASAAPRCHLSMKSRTKSERTLDTTSQSVSKSQANGFCSQCSPPGDGTLTKSPYFTEALDPLGPKPSPNHPHAMQGAGLTKSPGRPSLQVTFGRTNGRRPKQMRPNWHTGDARSAVSAVHEHLRSHRGNRYARDLPPAAGASPNHPRENSDTLTRSPTSRSQSGRWSPPR